MLKANRFQCVEIPVATGNTGVQFSFPDLPQLTGQNNKPVVIQSIVSFTADILAKSPISGSDVVTAADFKKSFLTLYQGDFQTIYNLPLVMITPAQTRDSAADTSPFIPYQPLLNNLENISWTKCLVTTPSALATTGVVYVFGIYYAVNHSL